ncbi:MAG: efflux RND transporter periplasmic adaptor subunit [Rhodospirillales bacterium]|nr:efflux RND transporter periplasmic adaptor subunit [Rhodospirillales bacterium]
MAGIAAAIWRWPTGPSGRHAGPPAAAIPVLVAPARVANVPIYLDGLGTVQAFNSVTVTPVVGGPLLSVNFRQGQDVTKGQVLARIDPRLYQAALEQAEAKKAQDEANLANARADLARYQKLVAKNYTSAQQAETQKALVAQLAAQVQMDQAQIDTARTQLSYCTITAPISGRSGLRLIDPGNVVQPGSTGAIVTIAQIHPISVVFSLPQQDLGQVQAALHSGPTPMSTTPMGTTPMGTTPMGKAPVLAYAQGAAETAANVLDRGTLSVLDNTVDSTTGTIKLKATFPNPQDRLWPGGFVAVRLQVATDRNAVVVPPAAVQQGPDGLYVYVVGADGKAARRTVTVTHEDADAAVIGTGLAAGERVVTDGASRLSDGARVAVAPQAGAAAKIAPPGKPRQNPARKPAGTGGKQAAR